MLCATSSVLISWSAAIATPGTPMARTATITREAPRETRAAAGRPRGCGRGQVGRGGPLQPVAERVELRVELGHRVHLHRIEKCLRSALRPRETRARTAWGEVARRSGRLVVAEVLDHAQADRFLLRLGEVCERLVEALEPGLRGLGLGLRARRRRARRAARRRCAPAVAWRTLTSSTCRAMPNSHGPAEPPASSRKRAARRARPARTSRPSGRARRASPGCGAGGSRRCARRSGRRARGTRSHRSAPLRAGRHRSSFAQLDSRHCCSPFVGDVRR